MVQSAAENYLATGAYRTHYIEAGRGEPVVLIHGGGAGADSRGNWAGCMPIFVQAGFRAIAYDMVGFGHSDAPAPDNFTYSQDARIAQLIALIEGLDLAPVNIVGNSMGGATALGAAMTRPDLIRKLVLMGSAGLSHSTGGALAPVINYDFTVEGMRRIIEALAHRNFVPPEGLVEYRHRLSIEPSVRAAFSATMRIIREHGGLFYPEEQIAAVKTETLVVHGKDDKVIPMDEGYRFLQLLDNSHGYFIPHCGHWAMMEHPKLFADVAIRFLKE